MDRPKTTNPFKANAPAPDITTYTVDSDPALMFHIEHLPETISCACGYVRAD